MSPPVRKRFRSKKQQAEWTEQLLVLKLIEMELNPSRPLVGNLAYDVSSENPRNGTTKRVQVKSVTALDGPSAVVHCLRNHEKPRCYTKREIDLLIVYVIPFDAWYIIPVEEVSRIRGFRLGPTRKRPHKRNFEKYREAWHLLL
jgi:hypothetical protein